MKNRSLQRNFLIAKKWVILLVLTSFFTSSIEAQNYCSSSGSNSSSLYIESVQFDGINNVSGNDGGYGDYTNLTANVTPGATYSLDLNASTLSYFSNFKKKWSVWIDYNADGDFDDSGERVLKKKSKNPISENITIPNGLSGSTRMRISLSLFNYNSPCDHFYFGEVEDYTVSFGQCIADAGTLTSVSDSACAAGGSAVISASADGNALVPSGYVNAYVLSSGTGLVIEQTNTIPEFTVSGSGLYTIHSLVFDPNTLDLSIVVPGVTTGFDVNSLLIQGGGSICASLDVAGASVILEAPNAGTLTADVSSTCLVNGMADLSATADGNIDIPAGYSFIYVLTSGSGLVIEQVNSTPEFTVTDTGLYTIHTLVYKPSTLDLGIVVPGVTTGFDVFGLIVPGGGTICANLDVAGAPVYVTNPSAGTMTADLDTVCASGGPVTITATSNGDAIVPVGFDNIYVLTSGAGLVIEQAGPIPSFDVTFGGAYTIHSLVFDPNTLDLNIIVPGTTTGFDVNSLLIQGGGSICASLDVAGAPVIVEAPNAGTLTADASSACLVNGMADLSATADGNINIPAGYSFIYVLTSGSGLVIEQVNSTPEFTVTDTGLYTIHTLVYNPSTLDLGIVVPGVTTGFDVFGLIVPGGGTICASLDVAGALVYVTNPSAGTMTADLDTVCASGGPVTITATPNGDAIVPAGFANIYVLTSGAGLVIEQAGPIPSFDVTSGGDYTIHSLVFDPNTLDLNIIVPGTTTGFDVNSLLIQGGGTICASLDVAGAPVIVEAPNAGTLTADASSTCLVNGMADLSATADGNIHITAGYSFIYVLTSGTGLVIEQVNSTPEFTVTDTGLYTIHTLVYNPSTLDLGIVVPGVTTGFDVFGLIVPGGGTICASLDVAGAPVYVTNPSAGTMTADLDTVCASGGPVTITATPNGDAIVPAGFANIYVLTSGAGLVIEQAGPIPSFDVTSGGAYTIHSLVFDPNTLDLNIIVPGTTTGFDVNSLLIQGGGTICASLDVAGAPIFLETPFAGTLSSDNFLSCINNGSSVLTASPNNNAIIPSGYAAVYVLTKGQGLVIEQADVNLAFTVSSPGLYRIHTLVFNPATLDLSIVVPGTTTGFDVNSLLVQGGGSICASLDVQGALFFVFPSFICNIFNFNNGEHKIAADLQLNRDPQETYNEVLNTSNNELNALISMYPNPSDDQVRIDVKALDSEELVLELYNSLGQLNISKNVDLSNANGFIQLDVSHLESGLYFIKLETANSLVTKVLEVQ